MILLTGPSALMWFLGLFSLITALGCAVRIILNAHVLAWMFLVLSSWTASIFMAIAMGLLRLEALVTRAEFSWGSVIFMLVFANWFNLQALRAARKPKWRSTEPNRRGNG